MCIRDRATAEEQITKITKQYNKGLISNDERYNSVIKVWSKTTEDVATALQKNLDAHNPIFMMADSGARGSMAQIRQLAGMRGLIANTSGKTIEIPILSLIHILCAKCGFFVTFFSKSTLTACVLWGIMLKCIIMA